MYFLDVLHCIFFPLQSVFSLSLFLSFVHISFALSRQVPLVVWIGTFTHYPDDVPHGKHKYLAIAFFQAQYNWIEANLITNKKSWERFFLPFFLSFFRWIKSKSKSTKSMKIAKIQHNSYYLFVVICSVNLNYSIRLDYSTYPCRNTVI